MKFTRAMPWLAAALIAPLLAHALLTRAVSKNLSQSLSDATGEAVTVDDVSVSLAGSLRIEGIAVGNILSAEAIEAHVSLSALIAGRLAAAEIDVHSPKAQLLDGGRALKEMLKRFASRRSSRSRSAATRTNVWPNIRVRGGALRVELGRSAAAQVTGLSARPVGHGLRLIAENTSVQTTAFGRPLELQLGRGAADLNLSSGAITRAVASGGRLRSGPNIELRDVEVSAGIEEGRGASLHGRWGAGGRVTAVKNGNAIEVSLATVDAALLSPMLGANSLNEGQISGNLGVKWEDKRASITGSASLTAARGTLPWLSSDELDLAAELAGSGTVDWRSGLSVSIAELVIERGPAALRLRGSLARPDQEPTSLAGELTASLDPIACSSLATALPKQLVGPLQGIRLAGTIGGTSTLKVGQRGSRPVELTVGLSRRACKVGLDAPRADVAKLRRAYEHKLPSGRTVVLAAGHKGYTPLASLPSHIGAAFIVAEDARFRRHRGFDERQIENSIAKNIAVGEFARGGSTISQQLAKNLFLTRERTFGRKLQEAVLAWRIEQALGKSEILERYLNVIQLSDTIYGIDEAARRWFGKSAKRLSPREAAFLASLTRAPTTTTRRIAEAGGLTQPMVRRVNQILKSMYAIGAIDATQLRRQKRDRLSVRLLVASAD